MRPVLSQNSFAGCLLVSDFPVLLPSVEKLEIFLGRLIWKGGSGALKTAADWTEPQVTEEVDGRLKGVKWTIFLRQWIPFVDFLCWQRYLPEFTVFVGQSIPLPSAYPTILLHRVLNLSVGSACHMNLHKGKITKAKLLLDNFPDQC